MDLGGVSRHSKCPNCDSRVPCQPTKKETDAMREEARLRLLKAQRVMISYISTGCDVLRSALRV